MLTPNRLCADVGYVSLNHAGVVANRLTELFGAEVSVGNAPADMTLEEVRAALAEISRKGYTAEIRSLLQKYGTDRLSELNPAHYRALLAEAEELAHAT